MSNNIEWTRDEWSERDIDDLLAIESAITKFVDTMRIKNSEDARFVTSTDEAAAFIDKLARSVGYYGE